MTDSEHQADVVKIMEMSKGIGYLLHGLGPDVQGGILAHLTSLWLGGHAPDIRDEVMALHVETIQKLLPSNDIWQRVMDLKSETH